MCLLLPFQPRRCGAAYRPHLCHAPVRLFQSQCALEAPIPGLLETGVPWADFDLAGPSVSLLRRSLERGRLGHAYLFSGDSTELLEAVAAELSATVNCTQPPEVSATGSPIAACGRCSSCRRIRSGAHPDVHWLRAESKMQVMRVDQVRELIQAVQLKPSEARYKVGILVGADRLNPQAGNAFLKTLEEPPSKSLLILLSTEPDRLLETILSRCLRLSFPTQSGLAPAQLEWLTGFVPQFQGSSSSILARYRWLDGLLKQLTSLRAAAEAEVKARSPAQIHRDADASLQEQWEEEAKAATEAEYRRRRSQTLRALQWWLRDVWITTLGQPELLLAIPQLASQTRIVASRLNATRALANLDLLERTQALLHTNVQEALALEVALLRLDL